jgi:hypothetical protein
MKYYIANCLQRMKKTMKTIFTSHRSGNLKSYKIERGGRNDEMLCRFREDIAGEEQKSEITASVAFQHISSW